MILKNNLKKKLFDGYPKQNKYIFKIKLISLNFPHSRTSKDFTINDFDKKFSLYFE